MAITGPVTKDTTTPVIGLAQVRLGASAANIASTDPVLVAANSIGAVATTKFISAIDFFRLESGYPLMEDAAYPIREKASMEVAFKEITPANIAYARGIDVASFGSGEYTNAHSGEINLGTVATPAFIRMESVYTYPDGSNKMQIIFPRAQVLSNVELDHSMEEPLSSPIMIEAKRADSNVTGGNAVWDSKPYGRIFWSTT